MSDFDTANLSGFIKKFPEDGKTHSFIADIILQKTSVGCIFSVSKRDDGNFDIILEELSYSRTLLDSALLESREYSTLLQNFDNYYFTYNGEKFTVKNTKDLTNLFEGGTTDFKEYMIHNFKLNMLHSDTLRQFEAMIKNLTEFSSNKVYNFLQTNKKLISIHTLKTSTRQKTLIVGNISIGKNSKIETNLYSEQKDGLTGLYNKKSITELAVKKINVQKTPCAMIIIDVDKFKEYNDTFGHIFGDRVLVAVSSCIQDAIKGLGIAGRIGGDEFLVILDRIKEDDIRNVTRNIRTAIQWSITSADPSCFVTCSMGIARFPENAKNYENLFKLADKCLYIAKNRGRNCYIIYKPELHAKIIVSQKKNENAVSSGKFFMDNATAELEILRMFAERKKSSTKKAVSLLRAYMNVDKITVYGTDKKVALMVCAKRSDKSEVRSRFFDDAYFAFFNNYNFLHIDNTTVLSSIDSKRYAMYSSDKIASIIEVFCTSEDGEKKSLICYDVYRPARTFSKEKVTFAIMAAKLIARNLFAMEF